MGCENGKTRFAEAVTLLNYGFSVSNLFRDENDFDLEELPIKGALEESVGIDFKDTIKVPNWLILLWGDYQCESLKV